jgi:UrcA family protein
MIRTTLTATLTKTLAATLAASALATAASAGEDSVVIDVSSVDFTDPAAVAAVYDEIVEASQAVCEAIYVAGQDYRVSYFTRVRMSDACVEATIADTIAAAKLPALSETHAMRDIEAITLAAN